MPSGLWLRTTTATDDTDAGDYAGLLLVQPYGKQTESFENCRILINNTTKPTDEGKEQLFYVYCGANDTVLTPATLPDCYRGRC